MSNRIIEDNEELEDKKVKSSKPKKKKNKIWIIALILEIIVLAVLAVLYAKSIIDGKIDKIDHVELEETEINEELKPETVEKMTGYTNIALFGVDTREDDKEGENSRSDTIIICSINNDTQEVKLVSVYRDTYLELANDYKSYEKATHGYAYGGAQGAVNMLNKNLDLNITEYVTVNFAALAEAIDALGGLDIEIKQSEIKRLNINILEQMNVTGYVTNYIEEPGLIHMDGCQATAYARIRSTDQGDITRTWRQRFVIQKMVEKAKEAGLSKLLDTLDAVVDDVSSSLSKDEIYDLAKNCFNYEMGTTTGFPFEYGFASPEGKGSVVAPADLETNVTMLHRFLFDDQTYEPTQTVKDISARVSSETGTYNKIDLSTYQVEDDVDSIINTK